MSDDTTIEGVDYGPLKALVGTWYGDKGTDVSPEPDGQEDSPYYETIVFEAIGDVKNAEKQVLAILRYHQVVSRKSNDEVFHDEVGYWIWDASSQTVMHSLTIPRGVCVLAGGSYASGSAESLKVRASVDDSQWGIIQAPFMKENAKTVAYEQEVQVRDNELSYQQTISLEIYGKSFDHTDKNTLVRK